MSFMKAQINYGLKKAEEREMLPEADLITIPHKGKALDVAVFGSHYYKNNIEKMSKPHFHSKKFPRINFRPATTSESISASAYGFNEGNEFDAKKKIFDPSWLQSGYIIRTQDGVFTNVTNTDEKYLKNLLNNAEKVNGIYLINKEVAFAPYESFKQGLQEAGDFAEGGLARVLEHTDKKVAGNLKVISSFYPVGVNVRFFEESKEPILRVSGLNSDDAQLHVSGYWYGGNYGLAFGVRVAGQ